MTTAPLVEAIRAPGLVGIPAHEWMWTATTEALIRLMLRLPSGSRLSFVSGGSTIAEKREELVLEMLAMSTAQWLLFVDADMTPPRDTVERLLRHDVDIVGATYFGRTPPFLCEFHPVAGQTFRVGTKGLVPVEWLGAGCLLIRRRVFEQLQQPWFSHDALGVDEDIRFCERARQAGFQIWMDADLDVGHIGVTPVDRRFVVAWHQTAHPELWPTTVAHQAR